MDLILKFILSFLAAIAASMIIGFLSVSILTLIVDIFKINFNTNKDNYWVFSYSFVAMIISWIITFGLMMSITHKD